MVWSWSDQVKWEPSEGYMPTYTFNRSLAEPQFLKLPLSLSFVGGTASSSTESCFTTSLTTSPPAEFTTLNMQWSRPMRSSHSWPEIKTQVVLATPGRAQWEIGHQKTSSMSLSGLRGFLLAWHYCVVLCARRVGIPDLYLADVFLCPILYL